MTRKNTKEKQARIDYLDADTRKKLLSFCRLKTGEIWEDKQFGHRVGVLDATKEDDVRLLFGKKKARLIVNDPPYNLAVGKKASESLFQKTIHAYLDFSKAWLDNCLAIIAKDAHLYIWIGADIKTNFQPLPDFMILMRGYHKTFQPKNFITMRNQRGYGTQKNWMWVRQELLHYTKGQPFFKVVYTDIPKVLKGYHKLVGGKVTDNIERGKADTIRPGNVWIDIQQVFYRMHENVAGCYAQKPIKSIERIIETSSQENEIVADFFSHSGTTLIAGEKLKRRVFTFDNDPIFAEITIRRLERLRETGEQGWQWNSPFPELSSENA